MKKNIAISYKGHGFIITIAGIRKKYIELHLDGKCVISKTRLKFGIKNGIEKMQISETFNILKIKAIWNGLFRVYFYLIIDGIVIYGEETYKKVVKIIEKQNYEIKDLENNGLLKHTIKSRWINYALFLIVGCIYSLVNWKLQITVLIIFILLVFVLFIMDLIIEKTEKRKKIEISDLT